MKKKKTIKLNDDVELYLFVSSYEYNNRLAIVAVTTDEDLYCDITINLPERQVNSIDNVFLTPELKYDGLQDKLTELGIIENIICTTRYNFGVYDLVKLNFDKLKEYDARGLNRFIKDLDSKENISNDISI